MRASLSLQLALFRRQKADIDAAVEGRSAAFDAYEAEYRRSTRRFRRAVSLEDVHARVRSADVVYVGDYHTLKAAQQRYAELVELAAPHGPRPLVMALEFFEGRHQALVDAYLGRRLSLEQLARRTGHANAREGLFAHVVPLLQLARARRLEVLAIDRRSRGPRSLSVRDAFAAERIAAVLRRPDRPRVAVLVGQFHIAPAHLPRAVQRSLGGARAAALTVYQNCDGLYWALARAGQLARTNAVELSDDAVCLVHTSPVLCQQSYLDYLEHHGAEELLEPEALSERFRHVARHLGRELGVDVGRPLRELEVLTPGEPELLSRLRRRAAYDARELAEIRAHLLARESCYLPRAKAAYLASLSVNHLAEEAAHFVRHCAVGAAMERPRSGRESFYARCVEEALGFFGSRLVNPHRRCPSLPEWAAAFQERGASERRTAAFVLAHKAAEARGEDAAAQVAPESPFSTVNAVAHGLGYLLGEALHLAYEEGRLSQAALRALFRDPLEDPAAVYFDLIRRCGSGDRAALVAA